MNMYTGAVGYALSETQLNSNQVFLYTVSVYRPDILLPEPVSLQELLEYRVIVDHTHLVQRAALPVPKTRYFFTGTYARPYHRLVQSRVIRELYLFRFFLSSKHMYSLLPHKSQLQHDFP